MIPALQAQLSCLPFPENLQYVPAKEGALAATTHQNTFVPGHKVPEGLHHLRRLPGRLEAGIASAVCFLGKMEMQEGEAVCDIWPPGSGYENEMGCPLCPRVTIQPLGRAFMGEHFAGWPEPQQGLPPAIQPCVFTSEPQTKEVAF